MPASISSRLYQGPDDLLAMRNLRPQARSQAGDWAYPHVGDLAWSFFIVQCHLNPRRHVRPWFNGQGLVAYAILGEDPVFDWQVLPAYLWAGIEEQAHAWATGLLAEWRREDQERWKAPLGAGARRSSARSGSRGRWATYPPRTTRS